eukprot:5994791-Pyramimonas_sp.AAC.1
MEVVEESWDNWRDSRVDTGVYYADVSNEEILEPAKEDVQVIRKYARRAPKRKSVPAGTAPLEIWHQCMWPNYRVRTRAGVGVDIAARFLVSSRPGLSKNAGVPGGAI